MKISSKVRIYYICRECGFTAQKWLGRCPSCYAWNTLEEKKEQPYVYLKKSKAVSVTTNPVPLNALEAKSESRLLLKMDELNRVFGGGIVRGSVVLLGGSPGIGKSTLMLQIAGDLSRYSKVLYVSAEESAAQLRARAFRLGIDSDKILVAAENDIAEAINWVENQKVDCMIVDSIQTVFSQQCQGSPGSAQQVRECAQSLVDLAKKKDVAVFVLGHITKDGDIAGPKMLEHLVDTVLYFEVEKQQALRMLKVHKNRFGPVSEIAFFEMTSGGLREIKNSSEYFLEGSCWDSCGSSLVSVIEGSRVMFLEVQALVSKINFGFPKRMVTGYDYNRVALLVALLENKLGLPLGSYDVFVNVVGGFRIQEPSADLGVLTAIAGAFYKKTAGGKTLFIGEIGLTGEVRNVANMHQRLECAGSYNFDKVIVPAKSAGNFNKKIRVVNAVGVSTINEAVAQLGKDAESRQKTLLDNI